MSEARDNVLIAEYDAQRAEEAFADLVRQHVNLVFATALRQVGNSSAAEEITQNVFIALARASDRLKSHPTVAGWLYRTTLNKSREWLRSELRRNRREEAAVELQMLTNEGSSVWSSLVPLLDEALLKLREADRLTVIMHFMEGRTFEEIASSLGVSQVTARKRVNRCLNQLTNFFHRRGFAVPALSAGAPLLALAAHPAPVGLSASVTSAALAAAHPPASASTLTLLKGALKIMAWTKTKTAVAVGVVALFVATSTTVIGIKIARAHHATEKTSAAVSPVAISITGDLEADGSFHGHATVWETNSTRENIRTDHIDDEQGIITGITDESGLPMKFERKAEGQGRSGYSYVITFNRPVPPGGRVSYSVEETLTGKLLEAIGAIKTTAPDEREFRQTSYPGNARDLRYIWAMRLPPGATLLSKGREVTVSTNAGRIQLSSEQTIPPNGGFAFDCRYRLPAQ